jgi:ferritin
MMSQAIQDAINQQIHAELLASYSYLAMSVHCDHAHFSGAASWLRLQSQEEYGHAMRLLDFMLARNAKVVLTDLDMPRTEFASLAEVFETAYAQEQAVSSQIDALYEMAFREKAYPAVVQLEWFLTEQVEEEKTCREVVAKLRMVGDDASAILEIDRELASRVKAAAPTKI